MTASLSLRSRCCLTLSTKKSFFICMKRMCGDINCKMASLCAVSLGPLLFESSSFVLARFAGWQGVASANGPSSSGFWTALADHSTKRFHSVSSLTWNSSSLTNLAMTEPCVSTKNGDCTTDALLDRMLLQYVHCSSSGRSKEHFRHSVKVCKINVLSNPSKSRK